MSLFKKKTAEPNEQEIHAAPKSKGSLLVLLVLVGAFAYLYFFTSLIVPHEAPPVKAPVGSPEVKQSMPPKPAAPPAAGPEAAKPEGAQPAAAPAAPAAPAAAKSPAPAPAAPAPQAAAKPAAPAPQPAAKPAAPAPQAAAKPAAPPAPAPAKKEAAAAKKDEVKPAEQKPAQTAAKKEVAKVDKTATAGQEKAAVKKKPELYAIYVGEFPAGEEAAAVTAKLAKLGIKPVARHESKKSRTMHRLFSAAFNDSDAYYSALDKLKQSAKGAFGIEKDGKYSLYAGSFSSKERADKEKKDLAAKGVTLQLQQVVLPLSSVRITAGHYASRAAADKAAARMKGAGLTAKVIHAGK